MQSVLTAWLQVDNLSTARQHGRRVEASANAAPEQLRVDKNAALEQQLRGCRHNHNLAAVPPSSSLPFPTPPPVTLAPIVSNAAVPPCSAFPFPTPPPVTLASTVSIAARSHPSSDSSCPGTDLLDLPALLSDSDSSLESSSGDSDGARRRAGSLYCSSGDSDGARSRRAVRLAAAAAVRFAQRRLVVRAEIQRCLKTPSPPSLAAAVAASTVGLSSDTSSSSDSEAPISKAAVRLAIAAAKKHRITIDDHTPTPSPTPPMPPRAAPAVLPPPPPPPPDVVHEHGGPIDPLNLWLATPKYHHQFLDLHAVHASDCDSCLSTSDSDELSSGFVSGVCVCVCVCVCS